MSEDAYLELRQTPLHSVTGKERDHFCAETAKWLAHNERWIRKDASERLASAILWDHHAPASEQLERLAWLFDAILVANHTQPDVLSLFVRQLRYQVPSDPQLPILLDWLDGLERNPPTGLDPNHAAGVRLRLAPISDDDPDLPALWLPLLDHPSDFLRGCAALCLGDWANEGTKPSFNELMALIGDKEILRPGIAGPFWSPSHVMEDWADTDYTVAPSLWMMDLLERRQPPVPAFDEIPSNDIDFFLHELCSFMPEMVDRMLAGGFDELAFMTATEIAGPVPGMEPRLRRLATHENPEIATRAARHLERHYS